MSSRLRGERARRFRLRHHQHVTLANEFERGGQLGSGGNRRHLLGEDFLAAGSFQVALLGGLGRPPARTVTSAIWREHGIKMFLSLYWHQHRARTARWSVPCGGSAA
jgi:hypothetical protein